MIRLSQKKAFLEECEKNGLTKVSSDNCGKADTKFLFQPPTKEQECFFNKVTGTIKLRLIPEEFIKIVEYAQSSLHSNDHHIELFLDNINYGIRFYKDGGICRQEYTFLRKHDHVARAIGE